MKPVKTLLPTLLAAAVMAAALLAPPAAHAGRSCEAKKPSTQTVERGLTLAAHTLAALEAEHARSGAQVVVLARAGQDLSKYGLRYSHLGLAYRLPQPAGQQDGWPPGQPQGQQHRPDSAPTWRVLHKLNHCGSAESALYRQGLGEFFLDDLWRFEAAWAVPTPEVQAKLWPLLLDTPRATALHHKPYSLVSYPWSIKYQQSNQWAIETLAAAMEPAATSRERAQAWLRFKGYEPTPLRLGALTRLGGRASAANVAFDDHPNEKRFADRIETVTVDSVLAWLPRAGLASPPVRLAEPREAVFRVY